MRRFLCALAGIVVGAVVGYCVIVFGWIGYTELAGVSDRDGGKIMGVAFVVAPAFAILAAIVGGVVFARRFGRAR